MVQLVSGLAFNDRLELRYGFKPGNKGACVQRLLCAPQYFVLSSNILTSWMVQEFWNWFDPTAWYPLGRVVGGTVYPGLMATSGVIYNILHALNLPVDIRNICVLLAPGFSALTAWATYM
jgi:dolichyl-diphosphooligosaccharide--protein glycosyltransferase